MSIIKTSFGQLPDGRKADLYILKNASGASVEITNFGGIIRAINVPDKNGEIGNVLLGYNDVSGYHPLCGCMAATWASTASSGKPPPWRASARTA